MNIAKGWMHDDVVLCKNNHFPDFGVDAKTGFDGSEEPIHPYRGDFRFNVCRENTFSGGIDGVVIQIGGKDLQRNIPVRIQFFHNFFKEDG